MMIKESGVNMDNQLYNQIKENDIDKNFLKSLQEKDCIFPEIDYKIYY